MNRALISNYAYINEYAYKIEKALEKYVGDN